MDAPSPNIQRLPGRLITGAGIALGAALVVAVAAYTVYRLTYTRVTLSIGEQTQRVETRASTVGELLAESKIVLNPGDIVSPAPDTPLERGMTIAIHRAHYVGLEADGEVRRVRTQAIHPLDILREQGIQVGSRDIVRIDGHDWRLETLERAPWDEPPLSIYVMRTATLHVMDSGTLRVIHTTQPDVGRALDAAGYELYLADSAEPGFSTPVEDGMTVRLNRSQPVTIVVDGRTLHTRGTGLTVADILASAGIAPVGEDYTEPPLEARFEAGTSIRLVRVVERLELESEPIPFMSVYRPDFSLAAGALRVDQPGRPGERVRQVRVRYEDTTAVERTVIADDVKARPRAQVIAYGVRPG